MFRKIIYLLLIATLLIFRAYLLQPLKRGKGIDLSIRYELDKDWLRLPQGVAPGNPTGISMNHAGHLVLFHRASRSWPLFGAMPKERIQEKTIWIIDPKTGKLINSWGADLFIMPHGLEVDHQDHIWVTDVGLHQVLTFSQEGKLLLTLGESGVAGNDSLHFNRPTDIAITGNGNIYVSDGYGNSRIVCFSPSGKYLFEWGTQGAGNGQFHIPHSLSSDDRDNLYVADREHNRIQVFNASGRFIRQFKHPSFAALSAVKFNKYGYHLIAADDLSFLKLKHRGSDVLVLDTTGKVQSRFGRSSEPPLPKAWYHDLTVDEDGNIYATDILQNQIHKYRRIAVSQ